MSKNETKCVRCRKKFYRTPGQLDAFCSKKCELAFKKKVGLPLSVEFMPQFGRHPNLVIIGKERIIRVRVKGLQ